MKKIKLLLLVFVLVAANLIIAPQLFADVDWQLIGRYLAVPAGILSLLIFARVLVTFGMPFWGAAMVAVLMWISASLVLVFVENAHAYDKRMEKYNKKSPPASTSIGATQGMNLA